MRSKGKPSASAARQRRPRTGAPSSGPIRGGRVGGGKPGVRPPPTEAAGSEARKPAAPTAEIRKPAARSPDTRGPAPARRRRSFSQHNLALKTSGPLGPLLGEALKVPEESGYTGTHAFHPYPGRFHPKLPRTLLAAVARPGQVVLDPFMGGGTTLVEALQLGMAAWGSDLNPVALLVTRERTRPRSAAEAQRLEEHAHRIAVQVEALRREKLPPRVIHRRQGELSRHYEPHLLAELMQWHRLIEAAPGGALRETLHAVFASAVVKFSNLASDSRAEPGAAPRRGKGAVSRFLVAKTRELAQAQVGLAARIPPGTPPPVLVQEDARLLPSIGWAACDVVLTSPPYPGTYDYHTQHALRMAWLDLDDAAFAAGEIGARRQSAAVPEPGGQAADATESVAPAGGGWSESLRDVLGTVARVLRPGGSLFLVLGDWAVGDHAVDAAAMLERTAAARDWQLASKASVQRDVHSRGEARLFARRGKWEHLLHFVRPATAPDPGPAAGKAPRRERKRSVGGRIRTL